MPSTDMSLELRWIFEGKATPEDVSSWFYEKLGSSGNPREDPYDDIYLFNPEVDYSSVKFRGESLDIKWRRNDFPINLRGSGANNTNKISGVVEGWVFWKWKDKKTAEEIRELINDKKKHPWIKVHKERSRIRYKRSGSDDVSLVPTKEEKDANCSIELVKLQIKDKNLFWWSLGLELFAGKKVSNNEEMEIEGIAEYLLKDYPCNKNNKGCKLGDGNSYGYPKLFSIYANSIR